MNSREKINSIKCVINGFYHDMKCKGNLTECANECWKEYQQFCEDIKKDLDRLEMLEKENEYLNKQLDVFFDKLDNNTLRAFDLISYELKDENEKLKKVIEMLKNKLDIEIYEIHENGITEYYLDCSAGEVIDEQEEYELLKEYFGNDEK